MAMKQPKCRDSKPEVNSEPPERDDAIEALYHDNPSLRDLYERGIIDQEGYEKAKNLRASGPPQYGLRDLVAALRAERERQHLSLTDIAERSGIDRAAVHKLEIGLNKNPTCATLQRYADALGMQIAWDLLPNEPSSSASGRGRVCQLSTKTGVHLVVGRTETPKTAEGPQPRSQMANEGARNSAGPESALFLEKAKD